MPSRYEGLDARSASRGQPAGAPRRANEVAVEVLLLHEADDLPRIGEGAATAVAVVIEDDAPGLAVAGWQLQRFDELMPGPEVGLLLGHRAVVSPARERISPAA